MSASRPVSAAAPKAEHKGETEHKGEKKSLATAALDIMDQRVLMSGFAQLQHTDPELWKHVRSAIASGRTEGSMIRDGKVTIHVGSGGLQQKLAGLVEDHPVLKLQLTTQEELLLAQIFTDRALSCDACLISVWGVDLLDRIEKMRTSSKDEIGKASRDFAFIFARLFAFLSIKNIGKEERHLPPDSEMIDKIIYQLEAIKGRICCLPEKQSRFEIIRNTIVEVEKRIALGCKLIRDEQVQTFFTEHPLEEVNRWSKLFHKAELMNKAGPQRILLDLASLLRLMTLGFGPGLKNNAMDFEVKGLEKLAKEFARYVAQPQKLVAVRRVKTAFTDFISAFRADYVKHENDYMGCKQELSYKEFVKARQITSPLSLDLPQDAFGFQLDLIMAAYGATCNILDQILRILDEHVIEPLVPTCMPMHACSMRMHTNIPCVIEEGREYLRVKTAEYPKPPMRLDEMQGLALLNIPYQMTIDREKLLEPVLRNPVFFNIDLNFLSRTASYLHYYMSVIPFLEKAQPLVNQINALDFTKLHMDSLNRIRALLENIEPEALRATRAEWVEHLKEVTLLENLDLCRFAMLGQDIPAMTRLHANTQEGYADEELFSDSLLDFFELTGIESILDELLVVKVKPPGPRLAGGPFPMREGNLSQRPVREKPAAPAPAPAAPAPAKAAVEKKEHKGAPLGVQAKPSEAPKPAVSEAETELFRIRRGEKTRKLLARLSKLGFSATSQRGSHARYEDQDGHKVFVPVGGRGHKHQRPGTAKNIVAHAVKA